MNWRVATPPESEPITLSEAKLHLRLEHADEDDLIKGLITSARQHVEQICEMALMDQAWELSLDAFDRVLWLPGGNVRQVNSIAYVDIDGQQQIVPETDYLIDSFSRPARVAPIPPKVWPQAASRINAVLINYQVGFEASKDIPQPLKQAMLLLISELYENREASVIGTIYTPTPNVSALLWPYRMVLP